MTPPIRFLASAMGSWVFLRGAMLVPWQADELRQGHGTALPLASESALRFPAKLRHKSSRTTVATASRPVSAITPTASRAPSLGVPVTRRSIRTAPLPGARPRPARLGWTLSPGQPRLRYRSQDGAWRRLMPPGALPAEASRWTASAWVHARGGQASALAPGGQLGGNQAGTRIGYRLLPALMLSGRLSAPLRSSGGAEGAIGAEWQPVSAFPVRLLAERRQRLGRGGRSAWAATIHGGVAEVPLPAGFRLDAYGQAGAVGARSRDLFAEGSARVSTRLSGGLSVGAGLWGAAQPGAARLDAGPSLTLRLPQLQASLSADWRFRAAGRAQPGSGPAITLWTDF